MSRKNDSAANGLRPELASSSASRAVLLAPVHDVLIRILIADDHPIFRDSLRALLELERGFQVVGEAPDGESTIHQVRRLQPDVLLLDIAMPRMSGLDVLRELSGQSLPVRALVLTAAIGKTDTLRALQLGARGVVLKSFSSAMLFEGIRRVMLGEYWIGQESVASLIDALGDLSRTVPTPRNSFGLTPREHEIILAVVSGYSNPEIAERFSLSEQTVKHHLTHIFDKLGVFSRLELALFAVNHHLAESNE